MTKPSSASSVGDPNLYGVAQFCKCPRCHSRGFAVRSHYVDAFATRSRHRTTTTSLTIHPDGDVSIDCDACDAVAIGHKLHESDRTYE